ncbi:hypothetical protein FHS13_000618 [Nocardiopsis algeriensis]|uniref:Uncharacterized protein n=2 Tax=Nocardiopsis algeriensis TaxID=1478215 RepID=A0A841IN48_9ACTN|nr:hypothetical protein [Nocardiopsis algeriensis]
MSTMCEPATSDGASDTYVYDPEALSAEQRMGDACAACHTRWPRPRRVLGVLPDGSQVFGCGECAAVMGLEAPTAVGERLFAVR